MKLALTGIAKERDAMQTLVQLASVFEGLASMRIAQIKDQVQSSERYFADLWNIYIQIRVDELFHFGRSQSSEDVVKKDLLILISSESSFSGDIDQRLINEVLKNYDSQKNDILVVGRHGATQLSLRGIPYIRSFKLPVHDRNINVSPILTEVQKYSSTEVYYATYVSLSKQDIKQTHLSTAMAERGQKIKPGEEIISEQNYIFEPSTYAVVDHLERSMMQIALSEFILESKLAQYASRFRAMSAAHSKADETYSDLTIAYNRARRSIKDERLKEVINGLKRLEQ